MVTRRLTAALALGVVALAGGARLGAQMATVDSIKPLLGRGNYVFEAVLQKVGVVADPILPANGQTAVARVTRVFACPREVGNFSGDVVTLTESGPHAPLGARSWYFGSGWAIGDKVAVRVLRRVDSLDDKASLRFIDSLRAAVRLSYTESVQSALQASDSAVIATLGTTENVMMDLVPLRTEHPERWARLNLTLDSIRVRRDTSAVWVPPTDATRQTRILVPYEIAYNAVGRAQMAAGRRQLLFFKRISDRPNLHMLDGSVAGFIPNAEGIRPLSDAQLIGSALPMPTFTLPPVSECP